MESNPVRFIETKSHKTYIFVSIKGGVINGDG